MGINEMSYEAGATLCSLHNNNIKGFVVVESEKCKTFQAILYFTNNRTFQEVTILSYVRCKMVLTEKQFKFR